MSNEITSLTKLSMQKDSFLALTSKEAFLCKASGEYYRMWEIGVPVKYVGAPNGEYDWLQAYGRYTYTTALVFLIEIVTTNTYRFSFDNGMNWSFPRNVKQSDLWYGVHVRFWHKSGYRVGDRWSISVGKADFQDSGLYDRWSTDKWSNGVIFSNNSNIVKFCQNNTICNFGRSSYDQVLGGQFALVFKEHLLVARIFEDGVNKIDQVAWSHLNDFSQWQTRLHINEADRYFFPIENELPEYCQGVTGCKKLGEDMVIVYTASQIHKIQYSGLPLVMNKRLVTDRLGCAFPYALVGFSGAHMFPSVDNFYWYNGDGFPNPVGDRIWPYFEETLSTNPQWRYKTYGYIDQKRSEMWWVYVSNESVDGTFDRRICFNYKNKVWYAADAHNIQSFLHIVSPTGAEPIDDHHEEIDTVESPINTYDIDDNVNDICLYGRANRELVREETPNETIEEIAQTSPFLETGDIYYSLEKVDAIDTLLLHATIGQNCEGVQVEFSARQYIDDPIEWKIAAKQWTPNRKDGRFSWPRVSGRIFRFRFTWLPVNTEGVIGVHRVRFSAWGENVRVQKPETER